MILAVCLIEEGFQVKDFCFELSIVGLRGPDDAPQLFKLNFIRLNLLFE